MKPVPAWAIPNDEEMQRQADLRRAANSRVRLTPEERMLATGKAKEETALANLAALEKAPTEDEGHQEAFQKAQLSEGLALQGRFVEAAEAHPSFERKAELLEIVEAIERPDDETCDCPPEESHASQMVYSLLHQKVMPLVRCGCGFSNVTDLSAEEAERLAQVGAAEREARAEKAK